MFLQRMAFCLPMRPQAGWFSSSRGHVLGESATPCQAFSPSDECLLLVTLAGERCGKAFRVAVSLQDIHALNQIVLNGVDMPQLRV